MCVCACACVRACVCVCVCVCVEGVGATVILELILIKPYSISKLTNETLTVSPALVSLTLKAYI